jgi:hypothetical protein
VLPALPELHPASAGVAIASENAAIATAQPASNAVRYGARPCASIGRNDSPAQRWDEVKTVLRRRYDIERPPIVATLLWRGFGRGVGLILRNSAEKR